MHEILAALPRLPDERLLVGFDASDDAAVYKINDETALIQTVDFFPPVVDDPFWFGQIAAANAISDVYAMGGVPRLAMNLLCFPSCLALEAVQGILAGGYQKAAEAGVVIAGGHTIEDKEPKYGLCVTGFAHPDEILTNSGAREGDVLVLTKPLGTGVLSTAAKAELLAPEEERRMLETMAMLNRAAQEAMTPLRPSACTDITGFGLLGHACELARGSGLTVRLESGRAPLLPGAEGYARMGLVPAGAYRNQAHFGDAVALSGGVPEAVADLLWDPQTSGGLLISIPEARAGALLAALADAGVPAAEIGGVHAFDGVSVRVR